MKNEKPLKIVKPNALEELARSMEQEYGNQHSNRVQARRAILQYTLKQVDDEIVDLQAAMKSTREQRAKLQAMILGLGRVLDKR